MLTGTVPSCPQDIIQEVDDLLENPEDLGTQPSSEQNCVASNLLLIMEHVLRELSTALPNGSLTFSTAGGTGKCPHLSPGSALAHLITVYIDRLLRGQCNPDIRTVAAVRI